jgi:hypothetical protein
MLRGWRGFFQSELCSALESGGVLQFGHIDARWTLLQWRIDFIRRGRDFGALGFAQRSFLVLLSLFLLALSTCRPRSVGSISSVIWFECHGALAG